MLLQLCTRIGRRSPPTPVRKQQTARSMSFLAHGSSQCRDARSATAAARNRMCGEKCKETQKEAPWPVEEPGSCLKIVQIGVMVYVSLKCIHLHKRALPPHSVNTVLLAPPQSGTEPLPTQVIATQHSLAHPTTKPLCRFLSVWETIQRISRWLLRRDRAWVRPSIQTQTTLFQQRGAVSNIASKCPGPETRAVQPVLKRSDRTSPGERAGEQLLQPLFCGAQERWRTPPDSRYQAHQQHALQASVQDDIAGTDPGANSPPGTGCVRGFKGRVLSHSDSTRITDASEVTLEDTAYQYPVLLFGLALAPRTFSKCMNAALSPLRASRMRVLNYLDDLLILAQSRDTPASHIDKLLRHLEFLRLCVDMC